MLVCRVVIVYSPLLSFQTPHSLPHVCSILLIVCSSLIVYTCSSSPSVFSLCVPVSRCQFVFVSLCLRRPSDFNDNYVSSESDPGLCNRFRFCFFPVCTSACSSIVSPYTAPALDLT